MVEQVLRMGRRGVRYRPFCQAAGVRHRGCSKALERALSDFGAEEAFGQAAVRVQEHYGIKISSSAIRRTTLRHAKAIVQTEQQLQWAAAAQIVTQADGSLIPVVQPDAQAPDARKKKRLLWREVRLCSARPMGKAQCLYGATLGSLETTSWMWQQTVRRAGLTDKTYVHGVGDGASWVLEKFKENFEQQGKFLLDFYHVSEYLAKAAPALAGQKKSKSWLRRQQSRLLSNRGSKVLKALKGSLEPPATPTQAAPIRTAYRYIQERLAYLDYQGARRVGYPIGSGEIESAHRHLIQKRLKLSGSWWKETNAQVLLNLRTARANGCWTQYWNQN